MLNHKMRHELEGQDRIHKYLMGGRGVVTLQSESGVHHTYRFQIPKNHRDEDDTMFIQTLIDGNTWVYVGMYKEKRFHLTKSSHFKIDSPIVKGVAFILKLMFRTNFSDSRMHLYHEGICSRCGRPLTSPESIESGIGPVCRDK